MAAIAIQRVGRRERANLETRLKRHVNGCGALEPAGNGLAEESCRRRARHARERVETGEWENPLVERMPEPTRSKRRAANRPSWSQQWGREKARGDPCDSFSGLRWWGSSKL
jgi:hypothetical protein